jgi:hypothetical protein
MWLILAREAAIDSKKDQWIIDLYDKAVASANDEDRQDALAYLEDHLQRRSAWSHSSAAPDLRKRTDHDIECFRIHEDAYDLRPIRRACR